MRKDEQAYGKTDMTKLLVAFRNFAKSAYKNGHLKYSLFVADKDPFKYL